LRPRPRPKIIMKKYQIMINNIRLRLLPEKLTKFPNFRRFLPEKMPDYIIRQRDRGQMFEAEAKVSRPAEAEPKASRLRPNEAEA